MVFDPNTADAPVGVSKLYRWPRDTHAAFDLRTKRDELKIFAQGLPDIVIAFMTSVITHLLSQQTTADAHRDFVRVTIHVCSSID